MTELSWTRDWPSYWLSSRWDAQTLTGLLVHTWTFRNDASGYGFADPQAEMAYYMQLGVDGVFTDFPDTGVAALQAADVPEPQTWALLLGGVALLGGLRHRQQRAGRQS